MLPACRTCAPNRYSGLCLCFLFVPFVIPKDNDSDGNPVFEIAIEHADAPLNESDMQLFQVMLIFIFK